MLIIALVLALSFSHLSIAGQVPSTYSTTITDCENEFHPTKDNNKDPTNLCPPFLLLMDLTYFNKQPTEGYTLAATGFEASLFKPPI